MLDPAAEIVRIFVVRCRSIRILDEIAGRARDDDHTSAHEQIIAPLLKNALAAYVYNGRKDSIVGAFGSVEHPLNLSDFSFLVRERDKFRLDLSRECVNGAEIFWSACSFRRG